MIENFENTKHQLGELAEVINSFKSEAVQLKIIELILGGGLPANTKEATEPSGGRSSRRKRHRPKGQAASHAADGKPSPKKPRTGAGSGAVATLRTAFAKDFFKEPRSIGDILEHLETKFARKIKANEISGALARMARSDELSREKNKNGQYEYRNFKA
jgi:hypothetical protein